jgi:uncharacterized phage protein gp47/JayE
MIELGHPFSKPYRDLIDALEQNIREGVEQPTVDRFIFQSSVSAYELRQPAATITRVSGLVGGKTFTIFQPELHYLFSNNRIIWVNNTDKPLDGGYLEVEYTYRERPAALTDFNPGSVVGTLVRAVARELKVIYEQIDQAYRRAFIDEASGVALDNVVALLGVTRNPALKAQGEVTFFLRTATNRNIPIPANTRVADEGGRAYVTTTAGEIASVVTEASRVADGNVPVKNKIAELEGIWPKLANSDQISGDPLVDAKTPGLVLDQDERTIMLGQVAPAIREPLINADGVWVRYKSKSVTISVVAVEAGPDSNVNSGAVVIMPTPSSGVNGVVNEAPLTGGRSPEADDQLRERAKHALERSGNATMNAIKFAVLEVDGVEGVEMVDHSADSTIPLGEVRVRYSGGDANEVQRVVEQTRAAGILTKLERINEILISGIFYLIADPPTSAAAVNTFMSAVIDAISQLSIGQSLSVRRLNALVYQVGGFAEVAEAQLQYRKADLAHPGQFLAGDVSDPLLIDRTELVRPDEARLHGVVLTTLQVQRQPGSQTTVDIGLAEASGNRAMFRNFAIDLSVTLRAFLQNVPDQPPEVVGRFIRTLTFTNTATIALTITPADAPQLRTTGADAHDLSRPIQVAISAAAFAGLQPTTATVDFSA